MKKSYLFRKRTLDIVQRAIAAEEDIYDDELEDPFSVSGDSSNYEPELDLDYENSSWESSSLQNITKLNGQYSECRLDESVKEKNANEELVHDADITELSNNEQYSRCRLDESTKQKSVNEEFVDNAVVNNKSVEEGVSVNHNTGAVTRNSKLQQRRRKHYCIFCDVLVNNFARHLTRQHIDEFEVQTFIDLPKNDLKRKQIIDKIRKEGDFCSGKVIAVQEKGAFNNESACARLPCIHCRGYYVRKALRKHVKRCPQNKTNEKSQYKNHQSDAHTLMAGHFGPNDPLRLYGVLKSIKADDIGLVAKKDKLICEVARRYIKSHREKHLVAVAKRYMRRLARLLIEVRKILNDSSINMLSILHPKYFQTIVTAVRTISDYNTSNKDFNSPSLALQMGTILKKAITAAHSMEIQKNINSPILNTLKIMTKLLENEWSMEVSTEANKNLNIKRFNKPTIIPVTEDLQKMKIYLDNLISESKLKLEENNKDETAYKSLIEATYCSLLLFNKKRVGFAFEELESEPAEVTSSEEPFLPQFNNFDMDTFLECDKNSSVFQEFNAEEVFKMVLEEQSKNNVQHQELSNSDGDTDNSPSAVVTTENEITFETASSMLNQLTNFAVQNCPEILTHLYTVKNKVNERICAKQNNLKQNYLVGFFKH
ncbi:hypothetical protein RN001_001460 [Aquatica leii]|uniref:Uncharacterized protein n=1 Tax=Aquatica leii TaxID=1421715 RepID=A0AAN7PG02_9COLE|nr:hypothetical protein RN001_001460 [Aquatica leii]